jgi:hypothetical protein
MEQLSIDENLSFCEMLKSKNMVEREELRYGRL